MKAYIFVLTTLLLSHGASAAPANPLAPPDKKTIQWVVHDLPPAIQLASADLNVDIKKATGPVAEMYRALEQSLPEYNHRFLRIPFVRAERLFQENAQFCSLLLQENKERRNYMIFGEEVAIMLPPGLVVLKANAEKFPLSNDHASIEQSLTDPKIRLGVVKGRYYSAALVPVLAKNNSSYNFVNDGSAMNLLAMLSKNRLDGVLAYYLEMAAFEHAHPKSPPLQFLRVKEAPDFTVIRVSCEKTAWGKKVLPDISKVVREKNFKEKSQQYQMATLPPERAREYQKIYDSRPVQ